MMCCMICSQIKFSLSTNCIFEVAIECHVEEAGPRTSCSPEKIFHLFYIFRLSLVGEAPFWPPRPFFGCNFWRPFPNRRKRRSYGADVILFWKSKVEEGEGRMEVEGGTWGRNYLVLILLDGQSVKVKRQHDKEEKHKNNPQSMMLHIRSSWE